MSSIDIKYLNKDFTDFKSALIEYAKAYYPQSYNDFSTPSPGTMFIDMAAYVGDVLSFYLDNQIQETFLQYAKQPANLYAMAYSMGYRPKVTSAATVTLDVYQLVPSKLDGISGQYVPDYDYALVVQDGMQISANTNSNTNFYVPVSINFAISGSTSPTEATVYSTDPLTGDPLYFLLKKSVPAISGTVRTTSFAFNQATKFETRTITDTNIIEILDVRDGDNNKWYEVPYLAQDTVLEAIENTPGPVPGSMNNTSQVPYFLQVRKAPRRFVTRFKPNGSLEVQFGSGINTVADEAVVFNPLKTGIGLLDGLTKLNTAYDPTNFTTTYTYGLAPANTTLTFTYLTGGTALANAPANTLTNITSIIVDFFSGITTSPVPGLLDLIKDSVSVTNPLAAAGGGDGDTVEDIRLNTLLQFPTQLRAVTQQDYIAHAYNMPAQFGKVAKAYIARDSRTFNNITQREPGIVDPFATTLYILGYDSNNNLTQPATALKENLKTYLSQYRMLTDIVTIKDAFIINIVVNFEVVLRPSYAGREVIAECINQLKTFFNVNNWQINEPIVLSNIFSLLDQVTGVQTVKKVEVQNKYGTQNGYSPFAYDIPAATLNNVIYPSLDPSIFEVKYPNTDIRGRVVTY